MKIEIPNTASGRPINQHLRQLKARLEHDHSVSIIRSLKQITDGGLLFLVSCNLLVDCKATERFKHALVLHSSDFLTGRGWSTHIWELLDGADCITVSLLDAVAAIDCGDIYKNIAVDIPRSALWNEINELIFHTEIQLIEDAIKNFINLEKYPQSPNIGVAYYPKRNPKDSEIELNKPVSEQFDLIKVCDPNRLPAHFHYRGDAYELILEKL